MELKRSQSLLKTERAEHSVTSQEALLNAVESRWDDMSQQVLDKHLKRLQNTSILTNDLTLFTQLVYQKHFHFKGAVCKQGPSVGLTCKTNEVLSQSQ